MGRAYDGEEKESRSIGGASQGLVGHKFNWIWFLGAAVWFVDAAIGLHHGALGSGLADAGISALFLVVGLLFRRQAQRRANHDSR